MNAADQSAPLRGPAADLIVAFCHEVGDLADMLTFCGGQCAQLLVTDPASIRVRPTDDLDAIAAVTTRTEYENFRHALAIRGVRVDSTVGAPTCRFTMTNGYSVDIMPWDESVLGMPSDWFHEAVETAQSVVLESSTGARATVRMVTAPALVALKWSAYVDRGNDDPLMSHDVEDILTVIAGRQTFAAELAVAPTAMRAYIARSFRAILAHPDLETAVEDAVPDAQRFPEVRRMLIARLRDLTRYADD